MNEHVISKLQNFSRDEALSNAVFEFVRDIFLKKKPQRDIQMLAAERLAVELLADAWRELERYSSIEEQKSPPQIVSGL